MIRPTRVDRFYAITDEGLVRVGNRIIKPDQAHTVHYDDELGSPVTVYVRGQVVSTRDGKLTRARSLIIFGRMGASLDHAPRWVRVLAEVPGVPEVEVSVP